MTRTALLIVGGGLRGCLTALALAEQCPDLDFLLVEQSHGFGGGPIPPFFDGAGALVEAAVVARWDDYYLALPEASRRVAGAIAWLVPEQLHAEIVERLPAHRHRLGARCVALEGGRARFEDGGIVEAPLILDARGTPEPESPGESWCHIASRTFDFAVPHQLDRPVLIDATLAVPGWSFLQYFPLGPRRLIIRYLRHSRSRAAIQVADRSGLNEAGVLIEEHMAAWRIAGRPALRYGTGALVRVPEAAGLHPLLPSPVAAAARFAAEFSARPDAQGLREIEARRFGTEPASDLVESLCRDERAAALHLVSLMSPAGIAALGG